MTKFLTSIIFGLLLAIGVGAFVFWQNSQRLISSSPENQTGKTNMNVSAPRPSVSGSAFRGGDEVEDDKQTTIAPSADRAGKTPAKTFSSSGNITLAEVAKHNSWTSCWSAINGNVYDLTSWIPNHPGGEQNILVICGKDGSVAFNGQHSRSTRAQTILIGFKIGVLTQ